MLDLAAGLKLSLDIADALAVAGHPRFTEGTGRDAGHCVAIVPVIAMSMTVNDGDELLRHPLVLGGLVEPPRIFLCAAEPAECPRCGCLFADGKIVNHACLEGQ
jgi:hypothetical protein